MTGSSGTITQNGLPHAPQQPIARSNMASDPTLALPSCPTQPPPVMNGGQHQPHPQQQQSTPGAAAPPPIGQRLVDNVPGSSGGMAGGVTRQQSLPGQSAVGPSGPVSTHGQAAGGGVETQNFDVSRMYPYQGGLVSTVEPSKGHSHQDTPIMCEP